jgi:predicted lipoprotein with Yx(FWY)xxD motif
VFAAQAPKLGIILFDEFGHTLYAFDRDSGRQSTCYGACAAAWLPQLTPGKPRPVDVTAAKLGASKRRDGSIQVTYAGHPLYTFRGAKPGDTSKNGAVAFDGSWHAIRPSGKVLEN